MRSWIDTEFHFVSKPHARSGVTLKHGINPREFVNIIDL